MASQALSGDNKTGGADEPEADGAERRQSKRYQVEAEVDLHSASNFYTGLTQDISLGGLFIATHVLRDVGDRIHLSFKLPGEEKPIEVDTEVRWVRESNSLYRTENYGMGLRFLNLSKETAAAIERFMTSRESLFYDDE